MHDKLLSLLPHKLLDLTDLFLDFAGYLFSGTFIRMMTSITQVVFAYGLPTTGKIKSLESFINNGGLGEWERSEEKGETICLASIFGGTSIS